MESLVLRLHNVNVLTFTRATGIGVTGTYIDSYTYVFYFFAVADEVIIRPLGVCIHAGFRVYSE